MPFQRIDSRDPGSGLLPLLLILICLGWLSPPSLPAQALQVEARLGGGINWSYGAAAPHIHQRPFPAYYGQLSLGYWVNLRIGIGLGLTQYPIGITHLLQIETPDISRWNSRSHSLSYYPYMTQLLLWYALPQGKHRLAGSQVGLGVLWARTVFDFGWSRETAVPYPSGQTVFEWSEWTVEPHRFWGIEARWNVPLWTRKRQRVLASLQVVKGLVPVIRTTRAYYIDFPDQTVSTTWTTHGDYLGLALAYQWTWWERKREKGPRPGK
ncbi:MAG: hypothetical protein D6722_08285 [Bacteroidetes bacterium]|nr:MAG: hypothetical protein D6722_08285 [Bacteroidota bacterium]